MGMRSKSAGDAGLAKCITTSTSPGTHTNWLTSCSTKVKPGWPNRCSMLSTEPVSRLSMAITESPRASSASHRCEPRKPAPPVTTTRAISPSFPVEPSRPSTADADVAEAPPLQRRLVEQVARVDHPGRSHEPGHLVVVEPAELVPLGQDHQHVGAVAHRVRVAHRHDAPRRGLDRGAVGPH